jgi:hypothetical protein
MEEEELTDKILSGDMEAVDLDALVSLLTAKEAFLQLRREMVIGGMAPLWIVAMDTYAEDVIERNADRIGDDPYALGYFQGMMAALNISMRAVALLGDDGRKGLDALEHAVNVSASQFAKVRNDAWPSELEVMEDYEN